MALDPAEERPAGSSTQPGQCCIGDTVATPVLDQSQLATDVGHLVKSANHASKAGRWSEAANYIKEAHQKLAWHHLIQGRPKAYRQYIAACFRKGETLSVDKE